MTEEQLIKGCTESNAVAQKCLYETYANKMMGICLRYASDADEAQDILQDGFVKVFEKIGTFKSKGSLEGWIRRIFVNTALDNYRKTKALKQSVEIDAVEYMLPAQDFILESLAAKELLKILKMIPAGYRTVFNMYAIEGYSHKEIAEVLDISVNTSKSQYSRAKSYLRNIIESMERVA
jgi:RNA polymerase sigma factor (sigma-70 family)